MHPNCRRCKKVAMGPNAACTCQNPVLDRQPEYEQERREAIIQAAVDRYELVLGDDIYLDDQDDDSVCEPEGADGAWVKAWMWVPRDEYTPEPPGDDDGIGPEVDDQNGASEYEAPEFDLPYPFAGEL